ncbi:Conserved_hypothetical protein [Hexamita inflata]|uniref:Uncharacterized protein n=1 Tax=Hexamita inflata TaxID=28002 RepID=A0AA86NWX0_9EUKA|nr:Conserved hypothetical protein [Hexamita inflata]
MKEIQSPDSRISRSSLGRVIVQKMYANNETCIDFHISQSDKEEQRLTLNNKQIGTLDGIQWLTQLRYLNLDNNNLTEIHQLQYLQELTHLSLNHNSISGVYPIASLSKMYQLELCHNHIADISPLSDLQVKVFYISYNLITDLSIISYMCQIEDLSIDGNYIQDFSPLQALINLQHIIEYKQQVYEIRCNNSFELQELSLLFDNENKEIDSSDSNDSTINSDGQYQPNDANMLLCKRIMQIPKVLPYKYKLKDMMSRSNQKLRSAKELVQLSIKNYFQSLGSMLKTLNDAIVDGNVVCQ